MVRQSDEGDVKGQDPELSKDVLKDGWEQTVGDMRAMAADREEKGFETLTMVSHNTAPISPGMGGEDDDRIGLSHLVDRNDAAEFAEVYEGREFTDTGVYQVTSGGHVFMVTEHIDYDNEVIIFIAGTYRIGDAASLVRAAMDQGKLHTYVRDGNEGSLGTFEHDDPSAFFPNPDIYESYDWNPDFPGE